MRRTKACVRIFTVSFLMLMFGLTSACSSDEAPEPVDTAEEEPTTTTAPEPVESDDTGKDDTDEPVITLTEEAQAAVEALQLIFNPQTDFAEKARHIEDAEALRPVVEAFTKEAGTQRLSIATHGAAVFGDIADVSFSANLGDMPLINEGAILLNLIDDTWMMKRDHYCGLVRLLQITCEPGDTIS